MDAEARDAGRKSADNDEEEEKEDDREDEEGLRNCQDVTALRFLCSVVGVIILGSDSDSAEDFPDSKSKIKVWNAVKLVWSSFFLQSLLLRRGGRIGMLVIRAGTMNVWICCCLQVLQGMLTCLMLVSRSTEVSYSQFFQKVLLKV